MKISRVTLWVLAAVMAAAGAAHAGEIEVDRGAYTLQAEEMGAGPITVVFESGFGQGAGAWKEVVAGLGRDYHSITYARADSASPAATVTPSASMRIWPTSRP